MAREVFVAIFDTRGTAEAAKHDLEAAGIPSADIDIRSGDAAAMAETAPAQGSQSGGFWSWLFGSDEYGDEQHYYREHLAAGRAVLSVTADSARYDRIAAILHGHDLVKTGEEHIAEEPTRMARAGARQVGAGETTLPTAKEELEVGKRQAGDTRAFRIRRYIIERPAEAQVALHDETVTVERREPSRTVPGEGAFEEKTVEASETHEEPVVRKVVKPGEEVVVRKKTEERTETVRDTVRESKVDVDRAAAGNKPSRQRRR